MAAHEQCTGKSDEANMRAWAIKHWRCGIYIDTVRRTRREAIETFMQNFYRGPAAARRKEWRDDSKYGVHRAVHVNVELK